jgi:hypothetical protein
MTKWILVVIVALAGSAAAQTSAADLRKTCTDAMNADPTFAKDIVRITGHNVDADTVKAWCADQDTLEAHQDAQYHVEKNERHVIYAYAAMWLVAAGFVVFLWRRQVALRAEIARLRADLDAAAKDSK